MNVHHSLQLSLHSYSAGIASTASVLQPWMTAWADLTQIYRKLKMVPLGAVKQYSFVHSGLRFCQINRMMKTCSVKRQKVPILPDKQDLTSYCLCGISYRFQLQSRPHCLRCWSWTRGSVFMA